MKKFLRGTLAGFLLAFCVSAAAIIGGGILVHNHSSGSSGGGTLNLSGTLSSTKACAANYVRVFPNFCFASVQGSNTGVTSSCSSIAAPAGASYVLIRLQVQINGSLTLNAQDAVNVGIYSDSGCATIIDGRSYEELEFTSQSQLIAAHEGIVIAPNVSGSARMKALVGAPPSNVNAMVIGYFD